MKNNPQDLHIAMPRKQSDYDFALHSWESRTSAEETVLTVLGASVSPKSPSSILRVADLGKLPSGTNAARVPPTELKFLSQIEPASPQPSIDRLSVTFAEDETRTHSSTAMTDVKDKLQFTNIQPQEGNPSEDEDYPASVSAILQRRASVRRSRKRHSGRRGSSPFSPDILPETENGRRRSSVFTTSSGDTAITMDESFQAGDCTQEQIFENIKLHKEVLASVKMQPWNMRKKLKLVMTAKAYIKKHEGALQERLAHSHSTRDMLARINIYFVKKLQHMKRETANLTNWLIPWELRIKEIESHFGSVVASYFIFLRWLFWVNIAISLMWVAFVAVPEMLTAKFQPERKSILPEDKYNSTNFLTLWDFEGVFKYSPMFYGWYTNLSTSSTQNGGASGYRLPLAYFFTGVVVYIFSFVATLRKMAENSRMSKLSEKEDECIFSWKLFTGWDYMIGNAETAHNRVASIIMGFKEALLEEAEKKREAQSWKIIGSRVLVNIAVLSLLALSAFAVITVVARSNEKEATSTTWRRNEITVVMSLISQVFPILFETIGYLEYYHPRKQLRLQLARIMILNLLNLYSLIFALFGKINGMTKDLQTFKESNQSIKPTLASSFEFNYTHVYDRNDLQLQVGNLVSFFFANLTSGDNFTGMDPEGRQVTDLYENVTETITTLAMGYFDNFTTLTQGLTQGQNDSFEWDFTPIQDVLEVWLTTVIDLLDNTNSSFTPNNTFSMIEDTFATFLNTTLTSFTEKDFDLEQSTESTVNSLTSTVPTSSIAHLTSTSTRKIIFPTPTNPSYSYKERSRLRSLCWETMFGQELVKLTIMDLIMNLLSTLAIDFLRGLFVRYMNNCWCWDLEKRFPQYGEFKVAENILHLVNNQGMVWMGMFFSPGVVVINVFKLYAMMYLRSWAVLTCNVPPEVIFRASRSNNFYYALLLMMLFLCVLPVSYAIVWLEPSWHCGPFSGYHRIFHIFTKTLRGALPKSMHKIMDYIASPGIVIPLLMLLVLIIYYLISLSGALREANNDLKIQLRRERTEERRKMFQIADRRRRGGSDGSEPNTPFGKWKKLLQGLPNKSFDDTSANTPKQDSIEAPQSTGNKRSEAATNTSKGGMSKFILRAIKNRKPECASAPDEDTLHNEQQKQEDSYATDTEQHDSLPDDPVNSNANRTDAKATTKRVKIDKNKEKTANATRKDSIASNWSDIIPVITISKTESAECILEDKNTSLDKIRIDVDKMVDDGKPKIRYVLKKQPVVIDKEDEAKPLRVPEPKQIAETRGTEKGEKSDVGKVAKKRFHESSSSTQTTDTRTESSTDYKDSTFSN